MSTGQDAPNGFLPSAASNAEVIVIDESPCAVAAPTATSDTGTGTGAGAGAGAGGHTGGASAAATESASGLVEEGHAARASEAHLHGGVSGGEVAGTASVSAAPAVPVDSGITAPVAAPGSVPGDPAVPTSSSPSTDPVASDPTGLAASAGPGPGPSSSGPGVGNVSTGAGAGAGAGTGADVANSGGNGGGGGTGNPAAGGDATAKPAGRDLPSVPVMSPGARWQLMLLVSSDQLSPLPVPHLLYVNAVSPAATQVILAAAKAKEEVRAKFNDCILAKIGVELSTGEVHFRLPPEAFSGVTRPAVYSVALALQIGTNPTLQTFQVELDITYRTDYDLALLGLLRSPCPPTLPDALRSGDLRAYCIHLFARNFVLARAQEIERHPSSDASVVMRLLEKQDATYGWSVVHCLAAMPPLAKDTPLMPKFADIITAFSQLPTRESHITVGFIAASLGMPHA